MISKELLGLAGEFAVCSELARRGIYPLLTYGNRKRIDILTESTPPIRISVKSKQGKKWPFQKGIVGDEILVYVDFYHKDQGERPDFYVLRADDWLDVARERIKHIDPAKDTAELRDGYTPVYYRVSGKVIVGTHIGIDDIQDYRERWDKLEAE